MGSVHPPGAVLLFWALGQLGPPALTGLLLGLTGELLLAWNAHRLFRTAWVDSELAGYATLLLLVLPAVQIYSFASLDILYAGLFLLTVAEAFTSRSAWSGCLRAGLSVTLAAFISFATLLLAGVLAGAASLTGRRRGPVAGALALAVVFFLFLWLLVGFDYWAALRTAIAIENPHGFRLFAEPVSYVITRLEDMAEILLFFGPFLTWLLLRHGRTFLSDPHPVARASQLAVAGLLALFLAGAYKTGETARACLFVTPALLAPVCKHEAGRGLAHAAGRLQLVGLTFGQTVIMQLCGWYLW